MPAQVSTTGILWPQGFEPQESEVWECVSVHACIGDGGRAREELSRVRLSVTAAVLQWSWVRIVEVWVFQLHRKRNACMCKIPSIVYVVAVLSWPTVSLYHYTLRIVIQVFPRHFYFPAVLMPANWKVNFRSSGESGFHVIRIFKGQSAEYWTPVC